MKPQFPHSELPQDGLSILVGDESILANQLFQKMVSEGHKGLYISKIHPRNLFKKMPHGNMRFLWLSKMGVDESTIDDMIDSILNRVISFAEEVEGGVVVIDGVECLLKSGALDPVSEMLRDISQIARDRKICVLVPLHSGALTRTVREKIHADITYLCDTRSHVPLCP